MKSCLLCTLYQSAKGDRDIEVKQALSTVKPDNNINTKQNISS